MKRHLYLLLSFLCLSFYGFSQEIIDANSKIKINRAYLKSYVLDTRDILVSPFNLHTKQYVKTAAFATATGALILFADKPVKIFAANHQGKVGDNIFRYGGEHWGDGIYSMPLMASFYLFGKITHNDRAIKTGLLGLKTFVVSSLIVNIPKEFFHRQRPYSTNNNLEFHGPFFGFGSAINRSFPSGHSMSAFAMATIIASEYQEYKIVPVVAYGLASLTALSRVYFQKHWSSDVFIGSAFGFAMAKLITSKNNWNISPFYSKSVSGINLKIPIQ